MSCLDRSPLRFLFGTHGEARPDADAAPDVPPSVSSPEVSHLLLHCTLLGSLLLTSLAGFSAMS